jgi:PRTase ComF-like
MLQPYHRFSAFQFQDLETAKFDPKTYSKLKFGCGQAAREMGHTLATAFFHQNRPLLLANRCVVFASPYNYVPNAATLMTRHFVDILNHHLVSANGEHVEYSLIHRKVSYTNDYGYLQKEERKALINNDKFYLNSGFIEDKLLIFVDDVRITGTHEDKLKEILVQDNVPNQAVFVYFADYTGQRADIESELNFSYVKDPFDYARLAIRDDFHVLVRPIKYVLGLGAGTAELLLVNLPRPVIENLYFGALAEGYYKIPKYQENFHSLARFANHEVPKLAKPNVSTPG